MERNLTGGLPVVYQGHLTNLGPFRECLTPAHEKKRKGVRWRRWECRIAKRTTGKKLGCKRRTRMQMQCAWWHDMRCMTWTKCKTKNKTRPRREYHSTYPKMARVGVTNMESYIRGVTLCSRPYFWPTRPQQWHLIAAPIAGSCVHNPCGRAAGPCNRSLGVPHSSSLVVREPNLPLCYPALPHHFSINIC